MKENATPAPSGETRGTCQRSLDPHTIAWCNSYHRYAPHDVGWKPVAPEAVGTTPNLGANEYCPTCGQPMDVSSQMLVMINLIWYHEGCEVGRETREPITIEYDDGKPIVLKGKAADERSSFCTPRGRARGFYIGEKTPIPIGFMRVSEMKGLEAILESELSTLRRELALFKAKDHCLPPGFCIGDDLSAEFAIKIVELEETAETLRRERDQRKPKIYKFPDAPKSCEECDSDSFITAGGSNLVCHICFLLAENDKLESQVARQQGQRNSTPSLNQKLSGLVPTIPSE